MATKFKILVVDEKEDYRNYVETTIRQKLNLNGECEFIMAKNGKIALEIVEKESIDMIISSLVMPGMNGVEFMRHAIRKRGIEPNKILVLSSWTDDNTITNGLKKLGLNIKDSFLSKNNGLIDVIDKIDHKCANLGICTS